MTAENDTADARTGLKAVIGAHGLFRVETQPVHAAVDFQPYRQRRALGRLLQQAELHLLMNHRLHVQGTGGGQFVIVENALHQHDRRADAGIAQRQPFFQKSDSQRVNLGCQHRSGIKRAVTIGIRLDHCQNS